MSNIKIPYYILAIILGIAFFVYGGYDDSPGAQGLALLIVIASIVGIVKRRKALRV
jgi:hypothetical protein